MRSALIFCFIMLLPALYLLSQDYLKYQDNPALGFKFSTIGEVWMDYDRGSFEQYKADYRDKPKEWDEDIRPYLEMNAFATVLAPALAIDLLVLVCWLLGIGPFRDWAPSVPSHHRSDSLMRESATRRGGEFKYRRK